jgi:FkbM family methyltransferase
MDGIKHDRVFGHLHDRTDYTAIFVEPVKRQFESLQHNVSAYLKGEVYCENVAVSNKHETVQVLSVAAEHSSKYPEWFECCSSVIENNKPINIFMKDVADSHSHVDVCNTVTVSDLLSKYHMPSVDYLQIDTEGYDQRILESIDIVGLKIKVLRFELCYLEPGYYSRFVKTMQTKNYTTVIDTTSTDLDALCVCNEYLQQITNSL